MTNIVYIFLISMLPLIELRGAVPVGAIMGVPFYWNFISSVLGNLVPIPFILLFIPKILDFLERFRPFKPIVAWLRKKADKHSGKILNEDNAENTDTASEKKQKRLLAGAFWGLLVFVFLPIPGTGAWSGALVASLFGLHKGRSMLAISLGVIGCGIIMCLASYGVVGFLSFLL